MKQPILRLTILLLTPLAGAAQTAPAPWPPQDETVALNEFDTFYVQNILPRAFATTEALAPVLDEIDRRRRFQSVRAGQLAWLSPALAFRRATEQLAGVTPVQQDALLQHARGFQREWRKHFGAKTASMTALLLADYDGRPEPSTARAPFLERFQLAAPALLGLVAVSCVAFYGAVSRSNKTSRSP